MTTFKHPVSIDLFFCGEEYHIGAEVDAPADQLLDSLKGAVMKELERVLWPQLKRSARIRQFKKKEEDIENYRITLHWEQSQGDEPDPDTATIWQSSEKDDKTVGYVDVFKMMQNERDTLDSRFHSANPFLSRSHPLYVTPGKLRMTLINS